LAVAALLAGFAVVAPAAHAATVTVPGAPTNVIAIPGNATIVLDWTAPSNGGSAITGYNVYQGTSPGGENYVTPVNGTTPIAATTVTVTDLTNAQIYYFTVKAGNALGLSAVSNETWAIPSATVPGAPTHVTAVPGDASATVSWTAPNRGGAVISSYTVTATDVTVSTRGGQTCAWTTGALSCAVSGLTNGDTYIFTVTATNSVGTGVASSASSPVVPVVTVPSAPTILTATPGSTTITLVWTAPSDGGSTLTGYNVYQGTSAGGEKYTTPVNGGTLITGTTVTVNNLTNAKSYYYTVEAANALGLSVASNEVWAIPAGTVPGAPTAIKAVSGDASATVTWTAPSNRGGSAVASYKVTAADSTVPARGGQTCTWTTGAFSCTVAGLTNGDSYTFTVTATNSVGTGGVSVASAAIIPAVTVPSAITNVVATPGNTTVALAWSAPANGGSVITGYDVYQGTSSGGENYSAPVNGTTPIAATQVIVTGLTNGKTYYFTVKAANALGLSAASTQSLAIPAATVPAAPLGITAFAGNASAKVTWLAPSSSGDSAVDGYVVTSYTGSSVRAVRSFNSISTIETIAGLTPGTAYSFTVAAVNATGTGAPSIHSNVVTVPKETTKTSLKLSVAKVTYGREQFERLSVTVSPQYSGVMPTGTVTISDSACRITLSSGKGTCTLPSNKLNVGSRNLVATYNGSAVFGRSASAKQTLSVVKETTKIVLKLSFAKVAYGHEQLERLSVTVLPQYSGRAPTGTITITDSACRITLSSGKGACRLSSNKFNVGSHNLVATYGGSAVFGGSASAKETLTVVK